MQEIFVTARQFRTRLTHTLYLTQFILATKGETGKLGGHFRKITRFSADTFCHFVANPCPGSWAPDFFTGAVSTMKIPRILARL